MQLEFNIKTILTNASIAAKYCDEIIRSEGLSMTAKKFFRDIERKLMSVERDVCATIAPEMASIIRKEISENWETLSFHNINTLLQAMTDEQRIKVETYCTSLLNAKPIDEVEKTCLNCKYSELDSDLWPCQNCDFTLINFTPKN
jgi:hypothetical protein